jgi:hypothetical protein
MAQIQKIDRARARAGSASDPLCVVAAAGSGAMRLQSMIGNTAFIIESEMFRDRRTLRQ